MELGGYVNALRRSEENIMKCSSEHHASTGYYYSFGNMGSFDKVDTSSVGQYVRKNCLI